MIGIVFAMPVKPGEVAPIIGDEVQVKDSASLSLEKQVGDIASVTDTVNIGNQTTTNFYIDERGIKHYIISAEDKPKIKP